MGNAVVQCFQHDFLVVFSQLNRQQLVIRQDTQLDVPYLLVRQLC